jgi:hypothetical protein
MKLVFCSHCWDVFKLWSKPRQCDCGKSAGHYVDDVRAIVNTTAFPLGFENKSFIPAIVCRPSEGEGARFTAWVMSEQVESIKVMPDDQYQAFFLVDD